MDVFFLVHCRLVKDLSSNSQHEIVAAVFLTDVEGLYDRPPQSSQVHSTDPPKLIHQIYVTQDGEVTFTFLSPPILSSSLFLTQVLTPLHADSTSSLSHDVTGGISSKIQTAINIVKETGVEIFLVQVGTSHAARALAGEVTGDSDADYRRREDWKGTRISLWRGGESGQKRGASEDEEKENSVISLTPRE
jgi:glutamate 5-kinase